MLRIAASQAGRKGVAGVLGSRLLRWRYGAPAAEALAMVPQQLRPADPSFADEIADGSFGLVQSATLGDDGNPFDIVPPSVAWERELHGFGWLRHLNAARREGAADMARALVEAWIASPRSREVVALQPDVTGRRIISWIANADLLLEDADQTTFDRVARSLVDQLIGLSSTWSSAPDGYPRLEALLGVVYGHICIVGHERHLPTSQANLAAELTRQIMPDGGHVSRNTNVLLELLLDLLPLRKCFQQRQQPVPPVIETAIGQMVRMLCYMRLGDGTIARFNGVGATAMAELSNVLAHGQSLAGDEALRVAPRSCYARLQRGRLVLVADVGDPPPVGHAGQAHAGALSFELSAGQHALLVNCGAAGPTGQCYAAVARATASHNALCFSEKSSARLVQHDGLAKLGGAEQVVAIGHVSSRLETGANESSLIATFDGYLAEHGLLHARRWTMSEDGCRLRGSDQLKGRGTPVRLLRDVPFAVHFHLHPDVTCELVADDAVLLTLKDGARWMFKATGAEISIEPSIHFADPTGPARSLQLVLRGACWGDMEITWELSTAP